MHPLGAEIGIGWSSLAAVKYPEGTLILITVSLQERISLTFLLEF